MSLYSSSIPQLLRALNNLNRWLDKAVDHAKAKNFDPAVYLAARLAPDQYPLLKQIQSAADGAKAAVARLTGQEPPKHADTEQTLDEVRARIAKVVAYLESFKPADFEGADSRRVSLPWWEGKWMLAGDYFSQHALPNFYFHLVTAYAILRHLGVDLGKADYLGKLELQS